MRIKPVGYVKTLSVAFDAFDCYFQINDGVLGGDYFFKVSVDGAMDRDGECDPTNAIMNFEYGSVEKPPKKIIPFVAGINVHVFSGNRDGAKLCMAWGNEIFGIHAYTYSNRKFINKNYISPISVGVEEFIFGEKK